MSKLALCGYLVVALVKLTYLPFSKQKGMVF